MIIGAHESAGLPGIFMDINLYVKLREFVCFYFIFFEVLLSLLQY